MCGPQPSGLIETELDALHACGCGHHAASEAPAEPTACACQNLSRWRRIHAVCALGFGTFAVIHLGILSLALRAERYQRAAHMLHGLKENLAIPSVLPLMILLLLAGTGLYLLSKAGLAWGVKRCKRGGKTRFAFQRWSALALLLFLGFHLIQARQTYQPDQAFASTRFMVGGALSRASLYVLGLGALAFHLGNGLSTAWEFWRLPRIHRLRPTLSIVLGLGIASLSACVLWTFLHS